MKYKGCIMEIRHESMVVMTTECSFYEVEKRHNIHEGMEIEFHRNEIIPHKRKGFSNLFLTAAAILLCIITSAYGFQYWTMTNQSMALITIDVNPSLQFEINQKNQVLSATPLNEEAKVFSLDNLRRKSFEEAFDIVLQEAKEKGYIMEKEENYILVTTVLFQQSSLEASDLEERIEAIKKQIEEKASMESEGIQIITRQASEEVLEKAERNNISVGKLNMYTETREYNEVEIPSLEIQDMQVKDLIEMKKAHPVFEQHPGQKEDKKESDEVEKSHPVFEQHPGQREDKKESDEVEKSHPVFEQHPGQREDKKESDEVEKGHPVFDQHPSQREDNKESGGAEKSHPVFEQHPGKSGRSQ